jgi:hypothetical protein
MTRNVINIASTPPTRSGRCLAAAGGTTNQPVDDGDSGRGWGIDPGPHGARGGGATRGGCGDQPGGSGNDGSDGGGVHCQPFGSISELLGWKVIRSPAGAAGIILQNLVGDGSWITAGDLPISWKRCLATAAIETLVF